MSRTAGTAAVDNIVVAAAGGALDPGKICHAPTSKHSVRLTGKWLARQDQNN